MRHLTKVGLALLIAASCFTGAIAQFKLYEKGLESYKAGKYADAISNFSEYLTKSIRDRSLDVEVYYLRGLSFYKTQNFKNATGDFQEALLRNHPNKGNIFWFLAKSHETLGFYPDAIDSYNSAIQALQWEKENYVKLYFERGLVYLKLEDLSLAYNDFLKAYEIQPGNQDVKRELEKIDKGDLSMRKPKPAPQSQPVVQNATTNQSLAEVYKDEKRYALVIGNSQYPREIGELRNPVNDATDIAAELRSSNFEVNLLTDATYGQMRAALLKFKEKMDGGIKDQTVALFYFAGHGLRQDEENYLVPVDAKIEFEDDIRRFCFPVQKMVLANMELSKSRMNIVILDACRNNPFPSVTRGIGQGLTEMKKARGSFIAYATAPGSVAIDGQGRNGLYTQEILKAMRKPGLTIEQVFKEVRLNVLRLSGEKQNTWDSSNITGEFYFKF